MCLQRIEKGKNDARDAGRAVKDGDALVSKLSHSARSYHVLHELGTLPGVSYLKKVVRAEPAGGPGKAGH